MLLCMRKERTGTASVAKLLNFLCGRGHLPENAATH